MKDGLAETQCVNYSGNISIDRNEATALARAGLVRQLNIKVQVLDETFQIKVAGNDNTKLGTRFSAVSSQLAVEFLRGSRPVKVELVKQVGVNTVCVMVTLTGSNEFIDDILAKSGANVSAEERELLRVEFEAARARDRLNDKIDAEGTK